MNKAYNYFKLECYVCEILSNCKSVDELYAEKIALRYTIDRLVYRYRTLALNESSPVENTENV
jgi:hypothetical protein